MLRRVSRSGSFRRSARTSRLGLDHDGQSEKDVRRDPLDGPQHRRGAVSPHAVAQYPVIQHPVIQHSVIQHAATELLQPAHAVRMSLATVATVVSASGRARARRPAGVR